jgi:hypothetical protein
MYRAALFMLVACSATPVGRICDIGGATPSPSEIVVASPSLDCVSRTCLRYPAQQPLPEGSVFPEGNNGLCTAECETDDDCERVPESPCKTGFTCAVALPVGPFCCKKFCVCKDYVVLPESGELATPKECDASVGENACCNLPGRRENPEAYPLCRN